jgi:RNA-binding protein YlmH
MNNNKLLLAKANDWARQVLKKQECSFYDFFDPASQEKIADVLKEYKELGCSFYGGYEYAERKMLAIYPKQEMPEEKGYKISILGFNNHDAITHRDVLGALMGLGINREKTGDILFNEDKAYIYLKENIAEYVIMNLNKIGSYEVSLCKYNHADIIIKEPEGKELNIIVASMRADGIISAAFKMSRALSQQYVKGERVKVNHQLLLKQMKELKEGDIVSIRGKGRIEIISENGNTKKGNIKLTVKRYV